MITEKGIKHISDNLRKTDGKALTLLATSYKGEQANGMTLIVSGGTETVCVASRGRATANGNKQHLEQCPVDGKTNCLTTVAKDNLIMQRPRGNNKGNYYTEKSPTLTANAWQENNLLMESTTKQLNPSRESNGQQPFQQNRVYDPNRKSPAHCASMTGGAYSIAENDGRAIRIRRLTPTECARLQTVPEWYKWKCSNTQQYKMLGNGWTVDVITHILSFLPEKLLKGMPEIKETENAEKRCGDCLLYISTHLGGECSLTDNSVDFWQNGCVDYIPED